MNVQALREYLADFPDDADVEVVVDNYPVRFDLAWGSDDGGTKATARDVIFSVGGKHESA